MSWAIKKNPITKELYKDNESDIVIALIDNTDRIFNYMVNSKYSATWEENDKKIKFGKYNYNDEDYVLVKFNFDDNYDEFIAFYNPLVIVIVTDSNDLKENLFNALNIYEINNNVILCINDEIEISTDKFNIINILNDNGILKLIRLINKISYEKNINKLNYGNDIETSISNIQNYLKKILDYKNLRWLSIRLLMDDSIISIIKENLNYDILNDKILLNLIKSERNKYNNLKDLILKYKLLEIDNIYS